MNHLVTRGPWACLLVFPLLLGRAEPATAGELSSTAAFAVARDPSGQRAAATADALLRARAQRAKSLRLLEPARVLSGDPRTREEETLERARTALADGRRAYDALKLDEAIARIGQSVNLYQQTGPLLGDLSELVNGLAYLGAALTLRGSPDEGESAFVELLTIDPNHQLQGYPPVVLKAFDKATKRVEAMASGSVEIYSTPPYAAVYLDGRFEGVTPLTLTDLVGGTHYLRIEKVGYTVFGAPLEVSPNQKISSQTRLRSLKRGVELRDVTARATEEIGGAGMGGALRALSRMLVADTLIFVGVTQSGNDATFVGGVYDGGSGTPLGSERAVLSVNSATFGADLDRFAATLIDIAERRATGRGSSAAGSGSDSDSDSGSPSASGFGLGQGSGFPSTGSAPSPTTTYPLGPTGLQRATPVEEYVGWSLVGVGGAAVITGIVFGVLAQTVHSDFRQTPQGSPDLESLRDRGKVDALISDLCVGGGLLAAVGGAIIVLVSRSSNPTPAELLSVPRTALVPTEGGVVFSLGTDFP